jgi:hypothetical protein
MPRRRSRAAAAAALLVLALALAAPPAARGARPLPDAAGDAAAPRVELRHLPVDLAGSNFTGALARLPAAQPVLVEFYAS